MSSASLRQTTVSCHIDPTIGYFLGTGLVQLTSLSQYTCTCTYLVLELQILWKNGLNCTLI